MDMPETINVVRTTERGGFFDVEYFKTAYPEHEAVYHHNRVLKAKDAEIEALHREIDENHKALRRWADSHEELRLEVELRAEISKLEAILEARGA